MNRHKMNIRIHDLCGIMLCLLFFFHRAIPIDYSSLWQIGVLCVIYLLSRQLDKRFILVGFAVWSTIESLLAILQKFGFISSNHPMFDVTGSFGNPGPLGELLAVGLLASVTFLYHTIKRKFYTYSIAYTMASLLNVAGLWLSQSRAAWVAVWISGLFLLCIYMYRCMSRKCFHLCWSGLFVLFILFLVAVYFLKKDSADGRLLIWTNTWRMVQEFPLFGRGTGGWLADYMHFQADYFVQHPDSPYLLLADNVAYPYNEYLLLLAEQGVVGFLLMLLFLYSLLFNKLNGFLEKALLLSFLTFAFFSYPSNVFALQLLLVAIIGMMRSKPLKTFPLSAGKFKYAIGIVLLPIALLSVHSYSIYAQAYGNIRKLYEGKREDALPELEALYPHFCHNPVLLSLYSHICMDYLPSDEVLKLLEETECLMPNGDVYMDLGDVWKQKGDMLRAERCYQTAMHMVSSRLMPKYKLFRLYQEQEKRKEALALREQILACPLKKESTRELRIKGEVRAYQ